MLTLDIETAPNTAYVWGLWKQNVGISQIKESGYMLCWAAKWKHKDMIMQSNLHENSKEMMLKGIHTLLGEADAVVHYNGTKFDIPWLNTEFARAHLAPPAPYHQIDLLKVVRNQFRFPSNKLEYVAKALDIGTKEGGMSFEDWIGCMQKDPSGRINNSLSWRKMIDYNIADVELTERLYLRLLPWIKQHPQVALYKDKEEGMACTNCGSKHYQNRGTATTRMGVYKRFQCQDCGSWFRGTLKLNPKLEMARII